MQTGVRITVQGLVQGVGFRYYALRHAQDLGLSGWVRNLPNGDVEVEAAGTREALEQFVIALRRGPRAAHVRDLRIAWGDVEVTHPGFSVC